MPSFNQGRYLREAISSVVDQGYPNLELIVIDGGSIDDSVEVLKEYDQSIHLWVSERDKGQADALNKGLHVASGEIVAWLNSDDTYVDGSLFRAVKVLMDHSDVILTHGDRILIDAKSSVAGWTSWGEFDPERTGYTLYSETAFWRASEARDLRFDESLRFAMDLDFFCRLFKRGRFKKLSAYMGRFRCHADSKSATIFDVAMVEGKQRWLEIFGPDSKGYKIAPQQPWMRHAAAAFTSPRHVLIPYLYRRFVKGRRGLDVEL